MNNDFTLELGNWLSQEESSRDYSAGALMLLRLTGNRIMYNNVSSNLEKHKNDISYHLQKYYNARVAASTHEEVQKMAQESKQIVQVYSLGDSQSSEFKQGKRPDHDSLPDDIQALYVENMSLRQRMRDIHARLRIMTTADGVCPDSDRYPFLKELISLDKQYRANWSAYDSYDPVAKSSAHSLDFREKDKKYTSLVNLNKGKYAKNPTDELGEKIKSWFNEISRPSPKLVKSLEDLGLI